MSRCSTNDLGWLSLWLSEFQPDSHTWPLTCVGGTRFELVASSVSARLTGPYSVCLCMSVQVSQSRLARLADLERAWQRPAAPISLPKSDTQARHGPRLFRSKDRHSGVASSVVLAGQPPSVVSAGPPRTWANETRPASPGSGTLARRGRAPSAAASITTGQNDDIDPATATGREATALRALSAARMALRFTLATSPPRSAGSSAARPAA
jgi:hypothetical protein